MNALLEGADPPCFLTVGSGLLCSLNKRRDKKWQEGGRSQQALSDGDVTFAAQRFDLLKPASQVGEHILVQSSRKWLLRVARAKWPVQGNLAGILQIRARPKVPPAIFNVVDDIVVSLDQHLAIVHLVASVFDLGRSNAID